MLVWAGIALTGAGLAGLGWVIWSAIRIRRHRLAGKDMQTALGRLVPVNLGALVLSGVGLACVAVGLIWM